jgi:hypothetical protein
MEAQHRLVFERLHGHGKFTFQAKHPTELKKQCLEAGIWNPRTSAKLENVLKVIVSTKGVPTTNVPNDIFLPLGSYTTIDPDTPLCYVKGRRVQHLELAQIMYKDGPILGALIVDPVEYAICIQDTNYVYTGALVSEKQLRGDKNLCNHAVGSTDS